MDGAERSIAEVGEPSTANNSLHSKYIPALDGWRGVAILSVMFWHLWPLHGGEPAWFVSFGWMGVDLFFALSGFLITRILIAAKSKESYFRNFFARRILRIFPLYYAVILVIYVGWPLIQRQADYAGALASTAALGHYSNLYSVATHSWFPAPKPFGGAHLWSLSVEEQFYLAWPFLVMAFELPQLLIVCICCIALSWTIRICCFSLGTAPIVPYVLTLSHMDGLAAGAALAVAATSPRWTRSALGICRYTFPATCAGLFVVAAMCRSLDINRFPIVQTLGLSLATLIGASIVFLTLALPRNNFLEVLGTFRPLRLLGKYSYGLYLYHGLTVPAFQTKLWPLAARYIGGSLYAELLGFLGISGFATCVAVISFHAFEQPILRLKRHFPEPLSPDQATGYR